MEYCVIMKKEELRGAWAAQWVKRLTLGFGSGHDLRALPGSPVSDSALSRESA